MGVCNCKMLVLFKMLDLLFRMKFKKTYNNPLYSSIFKKSPILCHVISKKYHCSAC